ncbi:MAG: pyruvate formate lyase family protein [Planctomycetota bacterium]
MTPRIQKLRDELLAVKDTLCTERAYIFTRTYKENPADAPNVKRAKGIKNALSEMTLYIRPGELIVGNLTSRLGGWALFPEFGIGNNGIIPHERPEVATFVTDHCPKDLMEFWREHSLTAHYNAYRATVEGLRPEDAGWGGGSGVGHIIVDYGMGINTGFDALADRVRKRREEAKSTGDAEGAEYLTTMLLCLEGAMTYCERFADLAAREAAACGDPIRKSELSQIAETCRRVARKPARTFREAVQLFWFIHLIMHIEGNGYSMSPGRFDQYMFPFYRKDLDEGRITRDEAKELIENLWIKFVENCVWGVWHNETQSLVLSGTDVTGRDLTNDLSFLCIEATGDVKLYEPLVWVRWHERIDPKFFDLCLQTLATGVSFPLFLSDSVVPQMMMELGAPREDACEYGPIGCNELGITGKMYFKAGCHVGYIGAVLQAMNSGREFPTFDDLITDIKETFRRQGEWSFARSQTHFRFHQIYGQLPFTSVFMDGCIDRARDMIIRTRYNVTCSGGGGFSNCVDSLAAIRKVVYDDKEATLKEVAAACKANFVGHEELHRKLMSAPKYGNDDDAADDIAARISRLRNEAIAHLRDPRDGTPLAANHVVRSGFIAAGKNTPATPDGRLAGKPIANSIGAVQGAARRGPTALLKSVQKLDPVRNWRGGYNFNIRLDPKLLRNPEWRKKVADMFATFFAGGGQELQVNAISTATLREAQKNPAEHRGLVVRVAGFSALFVDLHPDIQEEIIARTEHTVG